MLSRTLGPIPLSSPNAIQNAVKGRACIEYGLRREGWKKAPKVRSLYTTLWTQWGERKRPKNWYVPLKRWSLRLPQLRIPFAHSRHDLNYRRKLLTNDVTIKTNISSFASFVAVWPLLTVLEDAVAFCDDGRQRPSACVGCGYSHPMKIDMLDCWPCQKRHKGKGKKKRRIRKRPTLLGRYKSRSSKTISQL